MLIYVTINQSVVASQCRLIDYVNILLISDQHVWQYLLSEIMVVIDLRKIKTKNTANLLINNYSLKRQLVNIIPFPSILSIAYCVCDLRLYMYLWACYTQHYALNIILMIFWKRFFPPKIVVLFLLTFCWKWSWFYWGLIFELWSMSDQGQKRPCIFQKSKNSSWYFAIWLSFVANTNFCHLRGIL